MENQHRKIKGYRELSKEEIEMMNEIKGKAKEVGDLVKKLHDNAMINGHDLHWISVGKVDLQKGFMSLTRSVAKPEFF